MTLLITVLAAVAVTVIWYVKPDCKMKLGVLSLMYWGASLMWLADAVMEYVELGDAYFTPAAADMLNDAYLGVSALALGLIIWLAVVLITDPNGRIKALLKSKN